VVRLGQVEKLVQQVHLVQVVQADRMVHYLVHQVLLEQAVKLVVVVLLGKLLQREHLEQVDKMVLYSVVVVQVVQVE